MYQRLKKLAKTLLPRQLLFKHEFLLRKLFSIGYKGDNHHCGICKTNLNSFIEIEPNDLLCPTCGSRGRTRRLYKMLGDNNALQGNVLHFSPSRSLYSIFKKMKGMTYFSTDFENEFLADYSIDIRKIDFPSDYFDTIICYHIFEHIEEDQTAMSELFRVLKPYGKCYIQTPFKSGNIYEDTAITSTSGRLKAFGQEDHVRIYSIDGLKERLEQVRFKVVVQTFTPHHNDNYLGFSSPETVLIVSKS